MSGKQTKLLEPKGGRIECSVNWDSRSRAAAVAVIPLRRELDGA
jgi:hypothetical protein